MLFLFSFLSFLVCCVQSCPTPAIPWTVAHQAPLSMGFFRQEYWSGLPLPSLGALPDPGREPASLVAPALAGRVFTASATWRLLLWLSKVSSCSAGDPGSIPGWGRSAGEGKGYPLQYSWAFLVAQLGKNPPAMQETQV